MRWFTCMASVLSLLLGGGTAAAGTTVTFPFEDARYLQPGESKGGLAYLPDDFGESPAAVVVFLHGTNDKGPLHRWASWPGPDLRRTIDSLISARRIEPVIFAAPSQTRDASSGSKLWADFDLEAFVNAIELRLPPTGALDRSRIMLVGHSGAGCSVTSGLFGAALTSKRDLFAVAAIDTCLDGEIGRTLHPMNTSVYAYWQPYRWPREVDAFSGALNATPASKLARSVMRMTGFGEDAHDAIVPVALEHLLYKLVPARAP